EFDRTELSKLCSAREESLRWLLGDSAFWGGFQRGLTVRTSHEAGETQGDCRSSRSSRRYHDRALVSGALAPVALEERAVYMVDMVFTWFEWHVSARGLSRYLCTVEVFVVFLDTLTLVRESRRLLALRLVLSRDIAELGLHHQQCNFLTLYTSGCHALASTLQGSEAEGYEVECNGVKWNERNEA
ncbi:hypothetical protein Taro_005506, partial [Colocasia esculenta]|nr:hypothetical protein [Colocasia esculenta]